MGKTFHILLATTLILLIVVTCFAFQVSGNPKLAVAYLSQTNDSGRLIACFSITNIGTAPAINYQQVQIEAMGQTNFSYAACRTTHRLLSPGEGDIIQVYFPGGSTGRWRFTTLYAHNGLRHRIRELQDLGLKHGLNSNWLVPKKLKGVPLDVNTTSEWINLGDAPKKSSGQTN